MAVALYTISGTIYDSFNAPLPNVTVSAFDKDLRTEQLLGSAATDANGVYKITYDATKFVAAEYKSADVFLRVFSVVATTGAQKLLGQSPVSFNVSDNFTLDFKVDNTSVKPLNEFDRIIGKVQPLLTTQNVQLKDLKEDATFTDISFLSAETVEAFDNLSLLPLAYQTASSLKIDPAIFYGLSRLKFPTDFAALLQLTTESIVAGITAAVTQNIISPKFGPQAANIGSMFNQYAVNALATSTDSKSKGVQKVLGTVLPAQQQNTFINVYLANEATPDNFWTALSQQNGFTDPKLVNDLKNLLQLNQLTGNQPALSSLIFSDQKLTGKTDLRGLATLTSADWKGRIDKLVASGDITSFPDSITGANNAEKAANYATALYQTVKAMYPTDVFASDLTKNTTTSFQSTIDLKTFFANNKDFDLKTTSTNAAFNAANLTGIKDSASLKVDLTTINRLQKLTDAFATIDALNGAKLTSATAIVQTYSAAQFAQKFANVIGVQDAAALYKKAQQTDKRATALAVGMKMRNDISIFAINGATNNASPDYTSLFGDSACDCEECQSVYSPSAYLTDVLHFLQQSTSGAFATLTSRRPDITQILLTCENTTTPLPYIDLVNELLENTVAPQTDTNGNPVFPQTTNTAAELAAYPEHTNNAAYSRLAASTAAANLPLNVSLEETRLFVNKAGIKRYALMEAFYTDSNTSKYDDLSIAAEYLQLNNAELKIVNGTTPLPLTLSTVAKFLADTGLTYIETLQLLESYFINPLDGNGKRSISIVAVNGANAATCDVNQLAFQTATTQSLKIFPFIRLWKKTGWSVIDLDRVFTAFGVTDFSGDGNHRFIIPLSHVARLKDRLNLPVPSILSLWSNVDTAVYFDHSAEGQPRIPTQYETLFQNKKITNPVDADFANPSALSGTLAAKSSVITAALNLSQGDIDLLSQAPFTNGQLTLHNLSTVYGYALLARALNLSMVELINVIHQTALHPLGDKTKTSDTLVFVDKVAFIRSTRISSTELTNFLEGDATQSNDADTIATVLSSLREGLQKIEALAPTGATPGEQAANKKTAQNSFLTSALSTVFKTDAKLVDLLLNDWVKVPAGSNVAAFDFFVDENFINSKGALFTVDANNQVVWQFPDLINSFLAVSNTWNRLPPLLSKWKLSGEEVIYFKKKEAAFNLTGLWNLPVAGTPLYPAFERLYNLVLFRNALLVKTPDWFLLFDPALRNQSGDKKNFTDAFVAMSAMALNEAQLLFGKETDNNDTGSLKMAFPAAYFNAALLLQAVNCSATAARLGTNAVVLSTLSTNPANDDFSAQAQTAKNLLKTTYDEATWLDVIKPISNQLRIKKRDALIAFVLADPSLLSFRTTNNISDSNALFACFLIDVQMDACMLTSRIKQAISSVQLFVDRCLLNLENGITPDADFATQWNTWRKQYRVWEANREIFLYPENWIEPELRDDKSPFFKDLESTLKQNEVTDDTVTDALLAYLEKLDAVANMQIIGLFPDDLTGIVHVIGRTKNLPHRYYYTRQEKGIWSAWEKIELDIEGDQILPVVWNNRLLLFWALFTTKQANTNAGFQVPKSGDTMLPPVTYLEIKLAWSEYKNGGWKAKKQSKDVLSTEPFLLGTFNPTVSEVSLSSAITTSGLDIRFFVPYRTDLADVFLVSMGGYLFDGCNGAPAAYTNSNFNIFNGVWKIMNSDLEEMLITETARQDSFALYRGGVYLPVLSTADNKETIVFNNTPGTFTVLPNHHQIEVEKPEYFFYSNGKNNLYGVSVARRIPVIDLGTGTVSDGLSIGRRKVAPVFLAQETSKVSTVFQTAQAVRPKATAVSTLASGPASSLQSIIFRKRYSFQTFYHPLVCDLIKALNTDGIDGLYKNLITDADGTIKEGWQNLNAKAIFISHGAYDPTAVVSQPYPVEQIDFSLSSLYSIYNWELFFHVPLLIATSLSQNRQFDAARKWFHYIFDPTQSSTEGGAQRFWLTKPFKEEIQKGILSIEDLLNNTANDATVQNELDKELSVWEANPFNPHAVARLRRSAYMRSTVMKYIDNLIAWGDQLFTIDTIETINEATLLYVLAANILGKKPETVPARATPAPSSFSTIQAKLDSFSNAKVAVQNFLPLSDAGSEDATDNNVLMPMFCIPKNNVLLNYWDTVADRLFKIRHCLNIEGVFQQLPLFEPPIDPGLLVRAGATGTSLNNLLNELNVPLSNYRFQIMLQKAVELCNDVKSLGSELLTALEKKDAEQLSLIRSGHELNLLAAIRDNKAAQIDEAEQTLESLNNSRDVVQARRDYYASRETISPSEAVYLNSTMLAAFFQNLQIEAQAMAAVAHQVPNATIGPFSSGATYGGDNIGNSLTVTASSFGKTANFFQTTANLANVMGGFLRRQDEWSFQTQAADLELKQLDKQIAAAEIRVEIATRDLQNHDLQTTQANEVDAYLRTKFTNEDLYNYSIEQISTLYFQSYQLAVSTAKQAEKCLQYELGMESTSFIQPGYWDSLKKGLLSGEKLQYGLRRLENAYLQYNRRQFEITKHISLALINPMAVLQLKETGQCDISLPEELFDMDYPGHYFRRIKSVSLSLPCIAGPYTSVNATLRLSANEYRINTDLPNGAYIKTDDEKNTPGSGRFRTGGFTASAIATSGAQMDSGMFELTFRDDRYLPFEGAGVISTWHLELMADAALRQFDYETISDVIIHLRYTADEDGSLKQPAVDNVKQVIQNATASGMPLSIGFDAQHEFAVEWHRFTNSTTDTGQFHLSVSKDALPFFAANKNVTILALSFYAKKKNGSDTNAIVFNNDVKLNFNGALNLFEATISNLNASIADTDFSYLLQSDKATASALENLFVVINYTLS